MSHEEESFYCEAIETENLMTGPGVPTQAELFSELKCQPSTWVTKQDLSDDLATLLNTGLFQNVDANVEPFGEGYKVCFKFREKIWPAMMSFQVTGATILPEWIDREVLKMAGRNNFTTVNTLAQVELQQQ